MIPDIIKFFNGEGIPMFRNSGKIDWRNKTGYVEDPYTNQSGLTTQYSYGDVQKDENKFIYRDSRLQYTTPDNSVQTNYVREYKPNWRYKKYVKKYGHPTQPHMWTNHANDGTMSTDTFGYTPEQIDSLTTYFNTFGSL
jgi:hypothetical protein